MATLSRRNNLKNSITYVWMCGFQTILALVVSSASSNTMAGNSNPASWSGDKCLIVTAGGSLLCYGAFLLWEHHRDYRRLRQAEEGATAEEGRGPLEAMSERLLKSCASAFPGADTVVVAEAQPLDETGVRRKLHEMQMRGCALARPRARARGGGETCACFCQRALRVLWRGLRARRPHGNLLVLAFLGSIDDLTLFVPMLMGSRFIWYQLLLGATLASIVIVTFGLALMLFSPVSAPARAARARACAEGRAVHVARRRRFS